MRRIIISAVLMLLLFPLTGAAQQLDSAVQAALGTRLADYFEALRFESLDVQKTEADFLIESTSDPLVRQYVACSVYEHFVDSPIMGAEAVAIHVYDKWFKPGLIPMRSDIEKMNAGIFAEFNRQSLIGMKAPELVMETMEETVRPGFRCLDLGSGSGILSIAALRLGAQRAVGVDIDPKAEDIARENAAYNGFAAPEFAAYTGNVTEDRVLMEELARDEYDLVLVNIVADVIIGLSPVLPEFLTERSTLICSGILDVRLEDVKAALTAAGLEITRIRAKEDWRCISAKRR